MFKGTIGPSVSGGVGGGGGVGGAEYHVTSIDNNWVEPVEELKNEIATLKDMLLILQRHQVMEEKYPELKAAYVEYNRVLEKLKVFEILGTET